MRSTLIWAILLSFFAQSIGANVAIMPGPPMAAKMMMPRPPMPMPKPRMAKPDENAKPLVAAPPAAWAYFAAALKGEIAQGATKDRQRLAALVAHLKSWSTFKESSSESIRPIDLDLPAPRVQPAARRQPIALVPIQSQPAAKTAAALPQPSPARVAPRKAAQPETILAKPDWALIRPRPIVRKPKRLKPSVNAYQLVDRVDINGIQVLRRKAATRIQILWKKSEAPIPSLASFSSPWQTRGPGRIDMVGYEPEKPAGQRTIYVETLPSGEKRQFRSSPLVFDLGGGIELSSRGTLFDLKGFGQRGKLQWINDIGSRTGLLVFDADADGVAGETGLELFGSSTDLDQDGAPDGFSEGFAALRAFAEKAALAGVISKRSLARGILEAEDLAALESAFCLKMKVGGLNQPAASLRQAGVVAISLSTEEVKRIRNFDGQGNDLSRQEGAVFLRRDGSTGVYEDVWFGSKNGILVTTR